MQIMIDTANEQPWVLVRTAAFLLQLTGIEAEKAAEPINPAQDIEVDSSRPLVVPLASLATAAPPVSEPMVATPPPFTSIPSPPGPAPAPDLDKRGVPWSADYHASTKATTIGGEWKARRGVDKAALAAYEMPFLPEPVPAATMPVAPVAAVAPVMPVPPATVGDAAPAAVEPSALDFPTLLTRITEAMGSGTLTDETLRAVQVQFGVTSLFAVSAMPEKLQAIALALGVA